MAGLRTVCLALCFGGVLVFATPAAAVPNIIEEPQWQSGVTGGQSLRVRGAGCPPGSRLEVSLDDRSLRTRGSVRSNGRFEAAVRIPVLHIDDSVPEARELSLAVSCGEIREAIVVVYNDPLPRTGRSLATVSIFGALLAGFGILIRILPTAQPR